MISITPNSIRVTPEPEEWPRGDGEGVGRRIGFGDRTGERRGVDRREVAGAHGSAKGQDAAGRTRVGDTEGGERGGGRPGSGAPGSPGWEAGVAARRALTAAERGIAVPAVQAGGFPAGLPQGQVVLVVGRDPGRAQHGPQVQTQRQEDAHQPDQLQRGQHRHAHLLHAAAGRSHAPGAAAPCPAGGEVARRVRRAGSRTSFGGKQRSRRAPRRAFLFDSQTCKAAISA
uniref:Uncharacterized protein n=1 Tax=Mustela putorius furo TaxID=9669 RepID=M3YLW4_MUSPF